MKNKRFLFLVAFLTMLFAETGFQDSPQYKVFFEKAKFTMETKGDLNGAIDLFNEIIKKYPKEREYAAKSQLYIGLCYEKLGVREAQKAYRKVVDNYPEQTEAVKLANEKLGLLLKAEVIAGKEDKEFRIRRVKEGLDLNVPGPVSPDGRYILYADDALDLAVYEIATGQKRILVKGDIYSDAYSSLWSPDGKMVAYIWYDINNQIDLRIAGADGTGSRILFSEKNISWLDAEDWSPDGKSILATLYRGDNTCHMIQVSVDDGSVRDLKNFGKADPGASRFSPDGRFVAYTLQQNPESDAMDIFILPLNGGKDSPVVNDPANDVVLDWTPDGRGILFRSNRTGKMGAWWIQVRDGQAVGTPELVRPDLEQDIHPMNFTSDGSFYFATLKEMSDVYTAEIDFVAGKLLSKPGLAAQHFAGSNHGPDWSADGKELVYLSQREPGTWGVRKICIYSGESGKERELSSGLKQMSWVRWSPDGTSLMAAGPHPDGGYAIFSIDSQTGAFAPLMRSHIGWPAAWSRDGKTIFACHDTTTGRIPVVRRDLTTNKEKILFSLPDDSAYYMSGLTLSPDGQNLAFSVSESGSKIIRILPVNGGEGHELLHEDKSSMPVAFGFGTVEWTPDGRNVLFIRQTSSGGPERELWMIPAKGGSPRKLELKADKLRELSIHPDGKHIAFTAGKQRAEIWVMENFLPEIKSEEKRLLTLKKLDYTQLNTPYAHLSPDGKKIAYVGTGKSNGSINILDLESEMSKVLLESGASGQASMVWGPKSDKIACKLNGKELHVRNIDGSGSQLFYKNSEYSVYPTDWSKDGKRILCFFESEDWKLRIGTISNDGQVKFLASGNQTEFSSFPKFSPDGGYIAFSQADQNGNTDIHIITSDGSRKMRMTDYPGRDDNPAWSPDGKYLVFLSDRNRSVDLWGIQINNGITAGAPFVIKHDLSWRTQVMELTSGGKLFLFMHGGAEPGNMFRIPVDQVKGNLGGNIFPVSVYPTDHSFPCCSPDGKMIAYLSRRGQPGWPKLYVMDEKGAERELSLQGHYATNLVWYPENRLLYFTGWDKAFKPGLFELSPVNGEIKLIYTSENMDMKTGEGGLININLLPDAGRIMFFKFLEAEKGYVAVLTCNPDNQQTVVVLPRIKMPVWGLPSPNGENICYRLGDSLMIMSVSSGASRYIGNSTPNLEATWSPHGERLMFREGSDLRIFSVKDNAATTLYKAPAGKTIGGMEIYANSWSPNGNRFIFAERDTSASSTSSQKLMMINPNDGSVSTLGEAPEGYRLSALRWSPDGSKVMATGKTISRQKNPQYSYWVLENFLPK